MAEKLKYEVTLRVFPGKMKAEKITVKCARFTEGDSFVKFFDDIGSDGEAIPVAWFSKSELVSIIRKA